MVGGGGAASFSRIFAFFADSNIKFRFSQEYLVSHGFIQGVPKNMRLGKYLGPFNDISVRIKGD